MESNFLNCLYGSYGLQTYRTIRTVIWCTTYLRFSHKLFRFRTIFETSTAAHCCMQFASWLFIYGSIDFISWSVFTLFDRAFSNFERVAMNRSCTSKCYGGGISWTIKKAKQCRKQHFFNKCNSCFILSNNPRVQGDTSCYCSASQEGKRGKEFHKNIVVSFNLFFSLK